MTNDKRIKNIARLLANLADVLGDGAISPDEGKLLCQAGKRILTQLESLTHKRVVLFGLRTGISMLDWLEHDLTTSYDEIPY